MTDWTNHNVSEAIRELDRPTELLSQVVKKPGQPTQILTCPS